MTINLKPCPFCGKELDAEDPETLHPTGSGWEDVNIGNKTIRVYRSFRDVPKEQWVYGVFCDTTIGGCGATISGDNLDEAVSCWNRRSE